MDTIKQYYSLTKPGVLYGNALTTAAGFLLASAGKIDIWLFIITMLGTSLVIGSACALNNYMDQDIDNIMARTKKRALVAGTIAGKNALIFSAIIGIIGILLLIKYTNILVVLIGITGYIVYVLLYGMLSKRLSVHGTIVGSVSGAMPIIAGYCAVTGRIDVGAVILFMIIFFWQFPEFYSISIYRKKEYQSAGIPVISVVKGIKHTKIEILLYTFMFVFASLSLSIAGYTGFTYLFAMGLLGLYWLKIGIEGQKSKDHSHWAKKMFGTSLIVLLTFCFMISIDNLLP